MIAVCVKWVDGLTEPGDDRFAGISAADQAALEMALRHSAVTGDAVTVVTVGPAAAERALRDALACGAAAACRIDASTALPAFVIAELLAQVVRDAAWIWCGDYSSDRGTGSLPAFLADRLGRAQALGAVAVALPSDAYQDGEISADELRVTRRLDGGRRELLAVCAPAVVSVEGSVAGLRRASLAALLAARAAPIEVLAAPAIDSASQHAVLVRDYRPRARVLSAPAGDHPLDRLRALTDAAAGSAVRGETVHLLPPAAAQRIIDTLRGWGYLT
jgi:electron transfer flavoprotein beta subunit